ncbi:hypothetical protein C8R44DRAFT_210959 [Mycena epipterygia]|nr:hypothetical protein C8R44DRAFT_210959 [Mycena epipterygia]
MIDPALLALSSASTQHPSIDTSVSRSPSNFSASGCPSLTGSPILSVSPSSFGAVTPTDGWNGDVGIGVYSPGEEHGVIGTESNIARPMAERDKGKKRDFGDMTGWTDAEKEALSALEVLSKSTPGPRGKGKTKANEGGASNSGEGKEMLGDEFAKPPTSSMVAKLRKADVLKRAKQRREELALAIVRTRIALWETTIEGGVLLGLVKYYSKS